MGKDLGSDFLINEGLEDFDDMKNNFKSWVKSLGLEQGEEQKFIEKKRLQQQARDIGLVYWPALYGHWDIDPMAYVYAEQILFSRTGELWGTYNEEFGGKKTHGGWDSEGHHGVSASMVRKMWLSSGCKNNSKFKLQVEFGFIVGKRWNRQQTLEILKGKRWLNNNRFYLWRFTERACMMLGRISAPLRRVAVSHYFHDSPDGRPFSHKDIDWDRVSKVQKDRLYNPNLDIILSGERRAKVLMTIPECDWDASGFSKNFYPQYGDMEWEHVQALSMGVSPVELSGGNLTKKEAHQWLTAGMVNISALEWMISWYGIPYVREWKVAKWLKYLMATNRWSAMETERTQYHPERGEIKYTYLMLLDEIMSEDIHTTSDSVSVVMERLRQRQNEDYISKFWENHSQLVPKPEWVSKLPSQVTYLNTPSMLVREGAEMNHCVGTYVSVVRNGSCHILSIETEEGRSTVEFNKEVTKVVQHRGKGNQLPPLQNEKLLDEVKYLLVG